MLRTLSDIAIISAVAFCAGFWPGAFFLLTVGGLFLWLCGMTAYWIWSIGRG